MPILRNGQKPRSQRLGFVTSRKAFCAPGAVASANYTFSARVTAEAPFRYVRVGYENRSTTAELLIGAACAASGYKYNDDGTALAWTQLTFNDFAAGRIGKTFPSLSGSQYTALVPIAHTVSDGVSNALVPGFVWSDWVQITSVVRTNVGGNPIYPHEVSSLPLLLTRAWLPNGGTIAQSNDNDASMMQIFYGSDERMYATEVVGGDAASSPTGTAITDSYQNKWVFGDIVQFAHNLQGVTVACVGDSITAGQGYVSVNDGYLSWGHTACDALSTSTRPVVFSNYGHPGQHHTGSMQIARNVIDNVAPDIIMIWTWSPNDSSASQAIFDACWRRVMQVAQYAKSRGVIPILCTAIPNSGIATSGGDSWRLNINELARASGEIVCDMSSGVTDTAAPARLLSAYNSGDGTHPSAAAYSGPMTNAAVEAISKALELLS